MFTLRIFRAPITEQLQESVRRDWRKLCFALEGKQATALIDSCDDKYVFAKSFQVFDRDARRVAEQVGRAIEREDFSFFVDRGVPAAAMNQDFAKRLLKDWRGAITLKQHRISSRFEGRFDEELDVFLALPRNAVALDRAVAGTDANALTHFGCWIVPLRIAERVRDDGSPFPAPRSA